MWLVRVSDVFVHGFTLLYCKVSFQLLFVDGCQAATCLARESAACRVSAVARTCGWRHNPQTTLDTEYVLLLLSLLYNSTLTYTVQYCDYCTSTVICM